MKNLRVLLAAALPLFGAGVSLAQSPPPAGLFPSTVPADVAVGPVGPGGVPAVLIGEDASSSVPRLWINAGFAFNWASDGPLTDALLTTSDAADQGLIGAPSTVILLGRQKIDYGTFYGFRFGMGSWWNADRTMGSEGSTLYSEQRTVFFAGQSDAGGNPALFRPFVDPVTQAAGSFRVSEPGLVQGSIFGNTSLRFTNADSNLLLNLYRDEGRSWTATIGYRTAYIREQILFVQNSVFLQDNVGFFLGQPLLAGDALEISDRVETVNRMYVGQVGMKWERNAGRLTLGVSTKLGFGWANQRIYFDGRTTLEPDVLTAEGGALVQRSLPNRNQLEQFVFVPDVGIQARMTLLRRLQGSFSYNFTYFSNVARPGKYLDPRIELTQVPSAPGYTGVVGQFPKFAEQDPGFVIHGITAGLTWTY